jgi:hypothetical protein
MSRATLLVLTHMERAMANKEKNTGGEQSGDGELPEIKPLDRGPEQNEWLRDQVGEDHNLSGSNTYWTLPDQPADKKDDSDDQDTKDRQSNR